MKPIYILTILSLVFSASELKSQDAKKGNELFSGSCKACHSIGKGKIVGPDLKDVTSRRKEEWLLKFIVSPGQMIKSGDETAKKLFEENNQVLMPDHTFLKESDIKDILAFIKEESTPKQATAVTTGSEGTETKPQEVKAEIKPTISITNSILYALLTAAILLLLFAFFLMYQLYSLIKQESKKI